MKKLFLLAVIFISYGLSAQTNPGDLYIQNYTPHYIEYFIWRSNLSNTAGGCAPTLEPRAAASGGLMKLSYSTNPGNTSTDALHRANVNTTFSPNPDVPTTPVIGAWILNQNYANPYTTASPILNTFSNVTSYHGVKFGVQDVNGVNIGGYYSLGQECGTPIIPDLSYNPSAVISGTFFAFGGANWMILY
ncbi:hypothetical protein [Chryseobacterium sp.]|uniref:hypothetical protein n=1 Tax=Chryseobacterium sp. TaxID=1871047 RepID=UPI0028970679|nr:hypothetical protein [Chryseobacterium sp.]